MWEATTVRPHTPARGHFAIAQTEAFYIARAEEAAAEANNATLDNVRERALRAEASWRAMATRARRVETARARRADEAAGRPAGITSEGDLPVAGNDA